ncbi:MAG: TorF family putative porin [Draconibacterium sp.]
MKKTLLIAASLLLMVAFSPRVNAQEWNASLDIYSSYIWRGLKFGSGPAFQPGVEFSSGGFAIGGWGSANSSFDEAFEADLYAGYSFDLGENSSLGITLTDYYFGGDWTDGASHYFEPMASLGLGGLSLTGAYMFMPDGSYSANGDENKGDLYLEASYGFKNFSIGLGAGEGQYTFHEDDNGDEKDDFGICNINVGTSKEIQITDTFTLPVSGAVILNPTTGGFFITVGISL